MKGVNTKKYFRKYQNSAGKNDKKLTGAFQPPKNKITIKLDNKIILAYSPKKNNAKVIDEYSVLKPETNSDSASGKSKGDLLVSAKAEIKNKRKEGNNGNKNQPIRSCHSTIIDKLKLLVITTTCNKITPKETS
jgi:hypothetical protein